MSAMSATETPEFIRNFAAVMDAVMQPSPSSSMRLLIANYSIELKRLLRYMFLVVEYFPVISSFCGVIELIGTHGNREKYPYMIKLLGTVFEELPAEIQHALNTSFNFRQYVKTQGEIPKSHAFLNVLCSVVATSETSLFYYNGAIKILHDMTPKYSHSAYEVRFHMFTKAVEAGNIVEIRAMYSHMSSEIHAELAEEWHRFNESYRSAGIVV